MFDKSWVKRLAKRSRPGKDSDRGLLDGRECGMSWERRGGRNYFYRSVREGDRVRKVYVGTGPAANQAAEADRQRCQLRLEQKQRMSALVFELESVARFTDHGREEFLQRATELLDEAGYRYHRGSWRKRRGLQYNK